MMLAVISLKVFMAKLHGEAMDVESQYAISGLSVDGTRRAGPEHPRPLDGLDLAS